MTRRNNLQDCAKFAHCTYRQNVGSCPEGCEQLRHKNERRVVFCSECKLREDCDRLLIIRKRDSALGIDFLEYHRLAYCSAGEKIGGI